MHIKLLKEVVGSISGIPSVGLVDLLFEKKNVNEFFIAKKMKLNINQARNMLYRLADEGLVHFIRKKDRKNGGWYTYYWTLDIAKSLRYLRAAIQKDIEHNESQLGVRKHERFYHCSRCDLELNEENALINNFTCPECGEVFILRDNSEFIKQFEQSIQKRKEHLSFVERELGEVSKKEDSLRQRRFKADIKRKKVVRARNRAARISVKSSLHKPKSPKKKHSHSRAKSHSRPRRR